jgi:hypothetical protein
MYRKQLLVAFSVLCVGALAVGADWPNSICLPKGTGGQGDWACIEQGTRMCNWKTTTCAGSCTVCEGNNTVPPKMCFMSDGSTCTPATPYTCGVRFDNASCLPNGTKGACICQKNLVQFPPRSDGICLFSSCNN